MMRHGGRRRRWLAGVAAGAAVLVTGAVPAPAQAPPVLPVISVVSMPFILEATAYVDCDGVQHVEDPPHGYVVLARTDPPSSAQEPVEVGVTFSGDLADDVVGAPASVTVNAGSQTPAITFDLPVGASGSLTVGIAPGTGYEVGATSSASTTVGTAVHVAADCTAPLDLPAEVVDQSIGVGERPVDLPLPVVLDAYQYSLVGDPPPGLTFDGFTGRWSGAATSPGTYVVAVRGYLAWGYPGIDDAIDLYDGTAELRIVVEGPGGGSPPPPAAPRAPAATPVVAAADLTG